MQEKNTVSYYLLTGATGLLGRYLVKDLLLAGTRLAVIVRPTRKANVRKRMEEIMCYWDKQFGRPFPRPVVLEGDIGAPNLGLSETDVKWVSENCTGMIHNAASLTFHSTGPDSEPWRSNVQGTQHVLDLCKAAGIREFHHVSTSYVAGLREGRCLETELDVGQKLGNDYEISKVTAEKMVRSADYIDPPTVYRPSIIIGDSQTGLTNTFHGFYAPLQIVHTMTRTLEANETGLFPSHARLALHGWESKNLVPVDWVSAVMARILTQRNLHGQTYHLTPRHPVPVRLVRDIIEEKCGFYSVSFVGDESNLTNQTDYEQLFHEHMKVYNSYWRDDPVFDYTNTKNAAPDLPCPSVDHDMLSRLATWAIEDKFGGIRTKILEPDFDAHQHLEPLFKKTGSKPSASRMLGLQVDGHGGGQWHLLLDNGEPVEAELGVSTKCSAVYQMNVETFASLARGQVTANQAYEDGTLVIKGNGMSKPELLGVLQKVALPGTH